MIAQRKATKDRSAHLLSRSPQDTENIGFEIAKSVPVPGVVLLRGALGAGKTTLTRGIARGLGVNDPNIVNSPSFTLINIYRGQCPVYHVDLYRLEGERDLYSIGLDDFLGSDGVTIVEWSERLHDGFPDAILVEIEDIGDEERVLRISSPGKRRRHRSLGQSSGSPKSRVQR
jgi:tRNA threonylcarbamoyladenosine biosynthesis protein TsaE